MTDKIEMPKALRNTVRHGLTVGFGVRYFENRPIGFVHAYQDENDVLWDLKDYEFTDSFMIAHAALKDAGYVALRGSRLFYSSEKTIWVPKEKERQILNLLGAGC